MRHNIQQINLPSKIPFQRTYSTQTYTLSTPSYNTHSQHTFLHTLSPTCKLTRYLETTHVKLDEIPFFEKRAEALNWRRFRAEKWEEVR